MTQRIVLAWGNSASAPRMCQPTVSATATAMRLTPIVMWNHLGRLAGASWDGPGVMLLQELVGVLDDAPQARAPAEARGRDEREVRLEARDERPGVERLHGRTHQPAQLLAVRVPPQLGRAGGIAGHVLQLHHLAQAGATVRAPDPALLEPAPRRGRLAEARDAVVDADRARVQLLLEPARGVRVAGPAARGEAVLAVVREADRLVEARHRHDRQHGP